MKNLTVTLLAGLLFIRFSVNAQDCTFYFPTKVGATTETKTYDSKNKLTATVKSKVLEANASSVKFNSEVFDSKGKSISKGDYDMKCEGGEFVIDMKSYLENMDMSKYQNMEVNMETKNMSIPSKLQAGQKLNDGEVTLKISNNGFKILTVTIKITNRQVVGLESMTTPAGTFNCAKITSDMESKTIFTVKSKVTEWIAAKVGSVRTESRDQKDKLVSYSVLTSISQ
jgi:hypothetical protein